MTTTKMVLTLTLPNGETWCAYLSKNDHIVLRKAPIDANDVEMTWACLIDSISKKMREEVQEKWEGEYPCETRWVRGVRDIKKEVGGG